VVGVLGRHVPEECLTAPHRNLLGSYEFLVRLASTIISNNEEADGAENFTEKDSSSSPQEAERS
jgi:hypothetical protein